MSIQAFETVELHRHIDRIQAGDLAARDELLRQIAHQFERLARKMLRRFERVRRWADTDDVIQGGMMRLVNALKEIRPESVARFYGLAATQIRRELIDLARKFYGPLGIGTHHASDVALTDASTVSHSPRTVATPEEAYRDIEKWDAFHEAVATLSEEQREVIGLKFYHDWKREQIADLIGVDVRTVGRRYAAALLALRRMLKDRLPDL